MYVHEYDGFSEYCIFCISNFMTFAIDLWFYVECQVVVSFPCCNRHNFVSECILGYVSI